MDLYDKYEVIRLIDTAVTYENIGKLRRDVKQQLNNVQNDFDQRREQFLQEVAKLLFPERFQAIRLSQQVQQMKSDEEDEADCIDVEPCCTAPDIDKVAESKILAEVLGKFGIGQFLERTTYDVNIRVDIRLVRGIVSNISSNYISRDYG